MIKQQLISFEEHKKLIRKAIKLGYDTGFWDGVMAFRIQPDGSYTITEKPDRVKELVKAFNSETKEV